MQGQAQGADVVGRCALPALGPMRGSCFPIEVFLGLVCSSGADEAHLEALLRRALALCYVFRKARWFPLPCENSFVSDHKSVVL